MPKRRLTRTELEKRISQVADLLLVGMNRQDVARYVREKTNWRISRATREEYIEAAQEMISDEADEGKRYRRQQSLCRLDDLYKKSTAIQDYKTCLAVQKEINRLLGLPEEDAVPQTPAETGDGLFFPNAKSG